MFLREASDAGGVEKLAPNGLAGRAVAGFRGASFCADEHSAQWPRKETSCSVILIPLGRFQICSGGIGVCRGMSVTDPHSEQKR